MTKIRVLVFLLTIAVVGSLTYIASLYIRGYRLDKKTYKLTANGLLVANSTPRGAQVLVNGELKSATDSTFSLPPGTYDLRIKKDGFIEWSKRISIEKEVVTQIDIVLFPIAPSLTALTFSGVNSPLISPDLTKILFMIPYSKEGKPGLWLMELGDLPLGFNREPRQITDGNLANSTWEFSPDSRQALLTTKAANYLLDLDKFTPQNQRVNVTSKVKTIKESWEKEKIKKLESKFAKVESSLAKTILENAEEIVFSPDESKILYTVINSATLKEGLIKPLPGASTQEQSRTITPDKKYVYDIKEDRNFEIGEKSLNLYWFPTSANLIAADPNRVIIMDYDATNKQVVYSGPYVAPYAFPAVNPSRLIILTNLGSDSSLPNLYALGLK